MGQLIENELYLSTLGLSSFSTFQPSGRWNYMVLQAC